MPKLPTTLRVVQGRRRHQPEIESKPKSKPKFMDVVSMPSQPQKKVVEVDAVDLVPSENTDGSQLVMNFQRLRCSSIPRG